MLVSIRLQNIRSFYEKTEFSLQAESICEFRDSIIYWKRNKTDEVNTVPLHIILGDHNSGKTNLLEALEMLQQILLAGSLDFLTPEANIASFGHEEEPILLGFMVIEQQIIYDYEFAFLWEDDHYEVTYEKLDVNRFTLFERHRQSIMITKTGKASQYYNENCRNMLEQQERLSEGYASDELYLTGGFRYGLGHDLVTQLHNFIQGKLHIIFQLELPIQLKQKAKIRDFLKHIHYELELDDLNKLSHGSRRFLALCDLVFDALANGYVLCIDELDSGLQTNPVMVLTSLFHNRVYNPYGAQLLFITQNPLFLNKNYIRRDEVTFFTKPQDQTQISSLLTHALRENNYLRKFTAYEYGVIPKLDLEQFLPKARINVKKL